MAKRVRETIDEWKASDLLLKLVNIYARLGPVWTLDEESESEEFTEEVFSITVSELQYELGQLCRDTPDPFHEKILQLTRDIHTTFGVYEKTKKLVPRECETGETIFEIIQEICDYLRNSWRKLYEIEERILNTYPPIHFDFRKQIYELSKDYLNFRVCELLEKAISCLNEENYTDCIECCWKAKVTLTLHFTTPAVFPYWMGSAFRGGFGQNMRRAICIYLTKDCYTCETKDKCLFYYTHMKKNAERGHAPPVKPIVLIPPFFGESLEIKEDAILDVDVLFCGDFARYLPHIILGMNLFGKRGLYTQRYHGLNRFEVESITCCFSHKKIYDGETIFLKNLKPKDIRDVTYSTQKEVTTGFKTPFTGKEFPPNFSTLLTLIRDRVIRFVNKHFNISPIQPLFFNCNL